MNPSGIRPPKKLRVEKIKQGLYSVENAYEGEYEFFRGRPIGRTSSKAETDELRERQEMEKK